MMYLKIYVLILKNVFQNFSFLSNSAFGITAFYSHSTPSFTWKAGLKYTGVELHYLTDDKLRFLLGNNLRGDSASVMGNRFVKKSCTRKEMGVL